MALIRAPDSSLFLYFTLLSAAWRTEVSRHIISGATVDRIPLTTFPTFPINVPSADLIARFQDLVRPMVRLQQQLSTEVLSLRRSRDLLLPRLLAGQVRVAEAA